MPPRTRFSRHFLARFPAPTRIGRPGATDRGCLTDKTIIFTLGLARSFHSQERDAPNLSTNCRLPDALKNEDTEFFAPDKSQTKRHYFLSFFFPATRKSTPRNLSSLPHSFFLVEYPDNCRAVSRVKTKRRATVNKRLCYLLFSSRFPYLLRGSVIPPAEDISISALMRPEIKRYRLFRSS